MSGFGAGGAPPRSVSSETLEKIDMSLDDIIKLNKKEERKQYPPRMKRGLQQAGKRQFRMRRTKWGIQEYTGFGKNRLGRRKRVAGKRPPYGVKTGLAARKALGSLKGISPLNRSPLSEKNIQRNYSVLKRKTTIQRQSELQRKQGAILRRPTLLNRRTNIQSPSARIGNKLYQQKDARQATFLFKRGLKVQAQVHPEDDLSAQVTNRTRPWRTSTTNGGILTVSIDNPGAVPSPILKPRLTSTPALLEYSPRDDLFGEAMATQGHPFGVVGQAACTGKLEKAGRQGSCAAPAANFPSWGSGILLVCCCCQRQDFLYLIKTRGFVRSVKDKSAHCFCRRCFSVGRVLKM